MIELLVLILQYAMNFESKTKLQSNKGKGYMISRVTRNEELRMQIKSMIDDRTFAIMKHGNK